MKAVRSLLFIGCMAIFSICQAQQPASPKTDQLTTETKKDVIDRFLEELKKNYIFLELIPEIESKIKNELNSGKFIPIKSHRAFTDTLTSIVKEIANDNHLGIIYKPEGRNQERMPPVEPASPGERGLRPVLPGRPMEPVEFRILKNNIGYLRFDMFDDRKVFYDKIDEAFNAAINTAALVVDLRNCRGGSPVAENYVISYFLEPQVQLSSIFQRKDDSIVEQKFYTTNKIRESRYLKKQVFILTGQQTFSSAENFAYDMQALKRATVVGTTTKGGANPGREFPLGHSFFAFIPTGRSYSHITNSNWEGVGIKPDILTTDEEALDKACAEVRN